MPLFNREINLRVGSLTTLQGIEVSGLRVAFNINKNLDAKKPNSAEIQVYNLAQEQREQINKIDNIVSLEAGYADEGSTGVIFKGNIKEVDVNTTTADNITTIRAGDGSKALREVKFTKSYIGGTSPEQILNDIIAQFNLPRKLTDRITQQLKSKSGEFNNAFAAAGMAKDILNKVTEGLGWTWSIQDTELKINEKDGVDDNQAVLLNVNTGLIGKPKRINQIKDKTTKEQKKPGWQLISLLQPAFQCGGRVAVESMEIPAGSQFRIEAINHRGDNYGNEFFSVLEVSEYGN